MNTLRTGSIILEPQLAIHAAEMFEVLSDPAIYEFENAPPRSLDWLRRRFELLETRLAPDGSEQWLNWVVRLESGVLAGFVQATVSKDGTANVAYELASEHWGRGIGSACVRAMLDELSTTYSARFLAAILKAANFRSLALLRSLGFTAERPRGMGSILCEDDELSMYKTASPGAPWPITEG